MINFFIESLENLEENNNASAEVSHSTDDLLSDILQQNEEYREVICKLQTKIENIQELCDSFGKKQVSNSMIRKLQRRYIQKLESTLRDHVKTNDLNNLAPFQDIIDSQTASYMAEVEKLEEQLSHVPFDTLLKIEKAEIEEKRKDLQELSSNKLEHLKEFNERLSNKCISLLELNDKCNNELSYLRERVQTFERIEQGDGSSISHPSGQVIFIYVFSF